MEQIDRDLVAFCLWWESPEGDARTQAVLPPDLADFATIKEEFFLSTGTSLIEIAFLFTEILMGELDSTAERFNTIEEWLDSLMRYYRAETPRWRSALRARLSSDRPVGRLSPAVYHQGSLRTAIPATAQEFQQMVAHDTIHFRLL